MSHFVKASYMLFTIHLHLLFYYVKSHVFSQIHMGAAYHCIKEKK
jgi:hypothetical protein